MITLYGNASPNVLKISIALNELHLPYEWQHVNIWSGQQFHPSIKSLNPLSKVPILVENFETAPGRAESPQIVLFESGAILLYLSDKAPGLIVPKAIGPRMEAVKWLFVQCANIGPMFGQLTHFAKYAEGTSDYALRRYQGQVERLYDVLEERLSCNAYLSGDQYSVADIATYPWVRLHEMHVTKLGPAVSRWFDAISDRSAVRKAVTQHIENIRPADMKMRDEAGSLDLDMLFPGRS